MDSRIKKQLEHLETWMSEKEQSLSEIEKQIDKVRKMPFPKTDAEAKARARAIADVSPLCRQAQEFPTQYQKLVDMWGENCRRQQGRIAMQVAIKKARVKTFDDKTFRIVAAQTAKGALVVSGIALSLAASIISGGLFAPVFGAVVATGIAVSGVAGLGQILKDVQGNLNMEKRALHKVEEDLTGLKAAFGKVDASNSSLGKHITELMNLMRIREDSVSKLEIGVAKKVGEIAGFARSLAELRKDPIINSADIDDMMKSADKVEGEMNSIKKDIASLRAKNAGAQKVLDELDELKINLDKLARHDPNTILSNISAILKNGDAMLNLMSNVGGAFQAVGAMHK